MLADLEEGPLDALVLTSSPCLVAAVTANPAAVADYAAVGIMSLHKTPHTSSNAPCSSLVQLLHTLTCGVAAVSEETRCLVLSRLYALLQPLLIEGSHAAHGRAMDSVADAALLIRQLAVASVLSRERSFLRSLANACTAEQETGRLPSTMLSVSEQAALVHHLLLCPALQPVLPAVAVSETATAQSATGWPWQQCALSEVLSHLQCLCEGYVDLPYTSEPAGLSSHALKDCTLPDWLRDQVQYSVLLVREPPNHHALRHS